jgi:hypothetical protein
MVNNLGVDAIFLPGLTPRQASASLYLFRIIVNASAIAVYRLHGIGPSLSRYCRNEPVRPPRAPLLSSRRLLRVCTTARDSPSAGRIHQFEVVSGAEARTSGLPEADLATDYIRVHLPRPVPADGGVRLMIERPGEEAAQVELSPSRREGCHRPARKASEPPVT